MCMCVCGNGCVSQKRRGNGIKGEMSNHPGSRARVSEALYLLTSPNVGPGAPHSTAPFRTTPSFFGYANCGCGSVRAGKRAEAFRRLTRYKAANFKARFGKGLFSSSKISLLLTRPRNPNKLELNLKQ